jgi:hypothetical protein
VVIVGDLSSVIDRVGLESRDAVVGFLCRRVLGFGITGLLRAIAWCFVRTSLDMDEVGEDLRNFTSESNRWNGSAEPSTLSCHR